MSTVCADVPGPIGRLQRLWTKRIAPGRYRRLAGALQVAQKEIQERICAHDAEQVCWAVTATALLKEAEQALFRGQIDRGWKLLHAARRMEILALGRPEERDAHAIVLRAEAGKLRAWRKEAIEHLLGTAARPVGNIGVEALLEAAAIRDEHYDNQAYKDGLLRTQMLVLVLGLVAVMVTLWWMVAHRAGGVCSDKDPTAASLETVVLFGLLGAIVSGMLRVSDTGPATRIPELTAAIRVTFMRLLMGGASALVVYLFLRSPLAASLGSSVFSSSIARAVEELQPCTAYVISFVAGFSERLVLRAVEAIAGKGDDAKKAGAAS